MRKGNLLIASVLLAMTCNITSFAGSWQNDGIGYWWQNDDGSYPTNSWQWIDGNNDGTSEMYYFDANGYCLLNTTAPDGQTVNESGALIINGVIQTQVAATSTDASTSAVSGTSSNASATNSAASAKDVSNAVSGIATSPYDGYSLIVNLSTKKYHYPKCRAVKQMKEENKGYANDASYLNTNGYTPCLICH